MNALGSPARAMGVSLLIALFGVGATLALAQKAPPRPNQKPPADAAGLQTVQTPYYTMYTDLDTEDTQEASIRMTRMAEEYYERTKGFAGAITQRQPFYLFKKPGDYYNAGGIPGSAGVFMVRGNDSRLMAIAGEKTTEGTWHVVQHEGFHQFAHAVIGGELPVWVNEGMAEYFGESVWTGDGFVTGVMPPRRLKAVRERIENKRFKSIKEMMLLSHQEWNSELAVDNYHQAWAMSHFLAHGENGKYQAAFGNFMKAVSQRRPWQQAWQQTFGSADGFEKKWAEWWLAQPADPTADLYTRVTLLKLTSFIARAYSTKQVFNDLDGFLRAVKSKEFALKGDDWLPQSLLQGAIEDLDRDGTTWSIEPATKISPPKVIAIRPDKVRMVASFPLRNSRPVKIAVDVDDLSPTIEKTRTLIADGKKEDARKLIQDGIKRNPKSIAIEEAKKLVLETK